MPSPKSRIAVPYLRAWRLHRLLTQQQLAKQSGAGVATVIRAEQGEQVNALTAAKLARALDATVRQLQQGEPSA